MSTRPRPISSRVFNKKSVQTALKRAITKLKSLKVLPPNGVAIFCGEDIIELVEPPLPIVRNSYFCDNKFHTEEIVQLFGNYDKLGYIIATSVEVIILIVQGTERKIVFRCKTDIATATRRGGQSAARLARIREEKRCNYINKVVDAAVKLLGGTSGIIIAGNAEVPGIIATELKGDSRITVPIMGILKIDISGNVVETAIEASKVLIHQDAIREERAHIDKVKKLIETEPDKCVFGRKNIDLYAKHGLIDYVLSYSQFGSIRTILIKHDGFLRNYDGIIGVLFYAQSNCFIEL
jgi:peptide chain release factor subunit 1